jgi:hypothetical protein
MRRRCITCRRLIDAGSYCPTCKPRPADPGRIRGRRNQEGRARLTAAQGGRCARCGTLAPLELHHLDHDPAIERPWNLIMLCRRCHRIAVVCRVSRRSPPIAGQQRGAALAFLETV